MQLYIGNKNYSSWSLRPWLLMTQSGIQFEEIKLRLAFNDESDFKKTLAQVAPSGRVPVLVDEGFAVWDTLAIAEYLAEKYPSKNLAENHSTPCPRAGTQPLRGNALGFRCATQPFRHEHRSLIAGDRQTRPG